MLKPKCEIKSCKLDVPPPNNLIAENIDVLPGSDSESKPIYTKVDENTCLWYKKDDKFERPKGIASLKMYTKDLDYGEKSKSRVFVHVWKDVLFEYLREFNYMATLANLDLDISILCDNIEFEWQGFSDKMPTYIEQTITRIKSMQANNLQLIFNQVKENLL